MDLNSLIIFDKVAEQQSFTAAAKILRMPKSNVSLKISQLEDVLGVRLFERSTRKVRVTDYGQRIRNLTGVMIETAHEIRSVAEMAKGTPKGALRVSAPHDLGQSLIRFALPEFLEKYPDVNVELDLSNRYVNLIEEGYDLAIRASDKPMQDSSLYSIKLSTTKFCLYAKSAGRWAGIKNISHLDQQPLWVFGGGKAVLKSKTKTSTLKSTSRVKVYDMMSAKQIALADMAICLLPEYICKQDIVEGRLKRVLPAWSGSEASFYAIYPSRRLVPPRLRVFLDFVKDFLQR
jgi:DNA-binding transcriptional LysR family regulator